VDVVVDVDVVELGVALGLELGLERAGGGAAEAAKP